MKEHISVLLNEAISALNIKSDGIYLDGTFGRGGHSLAILDQLKSGQLYAIDRDLDAAKKAALIENQNFIFKQGTFSNFDTLFPEIENESLDGILLDLGVSSPQLDQADRGFSFNQDAILDMRMDTSSGITAKELINHIEYKELFRIIAQFGEERFAKQIARKIIKSREDKPIQTTLELAEIIKSAVPKKFHVVGHHPATRTFQAIRIFINDEIGELKKILQKSYQHLKPKGRLVIISFHSLEDSTVKKYLKDLIGPSLPPEIPIKDNQLLQKMKFIGRPVRPSESEISINKRARSSIMRVIEKQ